MLIHGFGEDSTIWQHQITSLQNNYQLIIPDIPGSGKSEFIENASIEIYATILQQILLKENINECHIIGHSMGGYIALALAKKHPQLIQSLTLFHSTAFADNETKVEARKKSIEFIKANGSYLFLQSTTPNLFYNQQLPQINDLIEKGNQFLPQTLIQYYEAMIQREESISFLKEFNKPVHFIIGLHDKAVPFEQSLAQCHLPSISTVTILRNTAHMGMYEETDKCNAAILSFLTIHS